VWQVFVGTETAQKMVDAGDSGEPSTATVLPPYQEREWGEGDPAQLNISVYLFRDDNRSGRYDEGDLPMAGVDVVLTDPDGNTTTSASNINGYANFKMKRDDPEFPISQTDQIYRFEVTPPPLWQVSSNNEVQDIHFIALEGSIAGVVAETAPNWVGLAPQLTVAGRLTPEDSQPLPGDLRVTLRDAQNNIREVDVSASGDFLAPVTPGKWQLQVQSVTADWQLEREFPVNSAPVILANTSLGAELPAPQPITVVEDFDWLSRSRLDKIPNGHQGLNWDYLIAVDNQQYGGPGYVNGLISGHAVAYNSSGHPVTISAAPGEVFDFVGGYFSVAWEEAHGEVLDVTAWREGRQVATIELKLSYLGPVWLDADFRSIDRITLTTRHYWQFVADDLVFRLANQASYAEQNDN
jgi:hypothetical protein